MPRRVFLALFAALVALRLPSLAQPAGADQGLYAYVGQRILAGDLPYRDAWDQKPPAIHYTYAAMFAAWPDEAVVAAVDLIVAAATAALLLPLARRLAAPPGSGELAALLLLFLGNPALGRLGGVRVRSQCEVFIALAVVASLVVALARAARPPAIAAATGDTSRRVPAAIAGFFVGVATLYKYNAALYLLPVWLALVLSDARPARSGGLARRALAPVLPLAGGWAIVPAAAVLFFAARGALADFYEATIAYNLAYSGETYAGLSSFLRYLAAFPVAHARVDSLWWLGGLGCVYLLARGARSPRWLVVPAWVAAACVSIAVNSSRGLPQYFLQAAPAVALAAAMLLSSLWHAWPRLARAALVALVAVGVWRVSDLPKLWGNTLGDLRFLAGQVDLDTHLRRFGPEDDKYSALSVYKLARYLRTHTTADEPVLVFGFSPGALVQSGRRSASRFFWSRPVIVGFNEGRPGYGVSALVAELERERPRLVVLQRSDWDVEGQDSATFFLQHPRLRRWLTGAYVEVDPLGTFRIFRRTSGDP
jgi:hypothetical protein